MTDEETRQKRALKFKLRNKHAKELREGGAFKLKVEKPKTSYKRDRPQDLKKFLERLDDDEYSKS